MKNLGGVTFQFIEDPASSYEHPHDVEALMLWDLMSKGPLLIENTNGAGMFPLQTANREFYMLFAEAYDYDFVLAREAAPGVDHWRFTKRV